MNEKPSVVHASFAVKSNLGQMVILCNKIQNVSK